MHCKSSYVPLQLNCPYLDYYDCEEFSVRWILDPPVPDASQPQEDPAFPSQTDGEASSAQPKHTDQSAAAPPQANPAKPYPIVNIDGEAIKLEHPLLEFR